MKPGSAGRTDAVLVVEDDPQALELAVEVLSSAGYVVVGAGTVAEALADVRRSRPDLVVLDVNLGLEDGLEVVRLLRDDPSTSTIPVIATSASTSQADIERVQVAGCESFLAKPLTARGFLEGVERCLKAAGTSEREPR